MKTTQYFRAMRNRRDRAIIRDEWIQHAIDNPQKEVIQQDGRIRRWAAIAEADGKYLRVILLSDAETVHNAFSIAHSSYEHQIFPGHRHALHRVQGC